MTMKQEGFRANPRYKIALPVEIQSAETQIVNPDTPPLRFESVTMDISLGGVRIDLKEKVKGLDGPGKSSWFQDRFFWIHIREIPTLPEGLYSKTKVASLESDKEGNTVSLGMEFQDLLIGVINGLKKYLDTLSRFE